MRLNRFAKYAWAVLALNVLVILWGAFVRATGSGAGCGAHWPLCDGEVIPRAERIETLIEFIHRATSGLALAAVVVLLVWAWRAYPKGDAIRKGAVTAMVFMLLEAAVGAGLVLFEWVAGNLSVARVAVMPVHLTNTFLLMASLLLTAWWASGGSVPRLRGQGIDGRALAMALVAVLVLSMAGAITALGDTLFPSETLSAGIRQDFEATSHFLVRLRVWHPVIAVITAVYTVYIAQHLSVTRPAEQVRRMARAVTVLFGIQLVAGLTNIVLLAPVWMQIVHLLLACLTWMALLLLAATALSEDAPQAALAPAAD